MILLRLASGIRDHFPARASEWLSIYPAVLFGVALNAQPDLFSTAPAYGNVASWMSETGWARLFLICAVLRLAALTINGTFPVFPHTPLIRLCVAGLTAMAWGQFCIGFLLEFLVTGKAMLFSVLLSHLVLVEMLNVYRSSRDMAGAAHDRLAHG